MIAAALADHDSFVALLAPMAPPFAHSPRFLPWLAKEGATGSRTWKRHLPANLHTSLSTWKVPTLTAAVLLNTHLARLARQTTVLKEIAGHLHQGYLDPISSLAANAPLPLSLARISLVIAPVLVGHHRFVALRHLPVDLHRSLSTWELPTLLKTQLARLAGQTTILKEVAGHLHQGCLSLHARAPMQLPLARLPAFSSLTA